MAEEEEAFEEEPEEPVKTSEVSKKPCNALSMLRRDLRMHYKIT